MSDAYTSVPGVHPAEHSESLPFTGLDIGLVGGAGLLLVVAGLALRRIPRRAAPGWRSKPWT
jgi:hypothetical protein